MKVLLSEPMLRHIADHIHHIFFGEVIGIDDDVTVHGRTEFLLGTVSVYLLAFVHAGASVFNQIEAWGINKSIGWHFGVLYATYSICYLINTWIPFDLKIFGIFTGIFIAVYAIVWITVYICVKHTVKKTNEQLRKTI